MARDKYGNYVNDEGVTIKITQDKNGKDHISFYDGPVDGDHSAVHVNVTTTTVVVGAAPPMVRITATLSAVPVLAS